jgi:hypothetical protein
MVNGTVAAEVFPAFAEHVTESDFVFVFGAPSAVADDLPGARMTAVGSSTNPIATPEGRAEAEQAADRLGDDVEWGLSDPECFACALNPDTGSCDTAAGDPCAAGASTTCDAHPGALASY